MAKGAARKPSEKPTSVAQWRKTESELVTLPSGRRALLRKPRAFAMIARDEIPNPILGMVLSASGLGDLDPDDQPKDRDVASYVLWICSRSFVDPRFHYPDPEKPDEKVPDDFLTVDDVDDEDLMHVFGYAQAIDLSKLEQSLGDLAPFLGERPGAGNGGDGESVRAAAEQPA